MLKIGVALLCAVPGLLMDNMENTTFLVDLLLLLVFDKADRILDGGF